MPSLHNSIPSFSRCCSCYCRPSTSKAGRNAVHRYLSTTKSSWHRVSPPLSASGPTASPSTGSAPAVAESTTQTFHTRQGKIKIDLSKNSLIGVWQSRGERPYQEDAYQVQSVRLRSGETERNLDGLDETLLPKSKLNKGKAKASQDQSASESADTEQAVYVGVFDGHNGASVSSFLKERLHSNILSVPREEVNHIVEDYRALGGYLRRYRGGILRDLVDAPAARPGSRRREKQEAPQETSQDSEGKNMPSKKPSEPLKPWNLHQRIHTAHLSSDLEIIATEKEAGSVSTVCLLHSLDEPRVPFYSSALVHLVVAHLGDTRALLCTAPSGNAVPLTETHHPEARSETDRLMKTRTGAVTDSFGESRWAGTLANTRGFGDYHYKALGVFAEPAIRSHLLEGSKNAFIVVLSDGVTDMLSDQEICDLVRMHKSPGDAAKNVIQFAENIGGQDNLTCIVVPLAGWGKATGEDTTKARRNFRLENYGERSHRQNRM